VFGEACVFPTDPIKASPAAALPDSLQSLLEQVADTVARIAAELSRAGPTVTPAILAERRPSVYQAMEALGGGILDFLATDPSPEEIEGARERVSAPILAWSSSSPVFQHSLRTARGLRADYEVIEHVRASRPAGADLIALIFNDYYQNTRLAEALRQRLDLVADQLRCAVKACLGRGNSPVRILSLQSTPGFELLKLADEPEFAETQITCLGESAGTLRLARQRLRRPLGQRITFVRADPLQLDRGAMRYALPYEIIYAVSLADLCSEPQIVNMIRRCWTLLEPGGFLISGHRSTGVPAHERILAEWLYGLNAQYRDEEEIRQIFAQTPFGADRLKLVREPLGIDLLATVERTGAG
jgi:SAM-dependent methyltransferase